MGSLILRPIGYQTGFGTLISSSLRPGLARVGGAHDWAVLGDNDGLSGSCMQCTGGGSSDITGSSSFTVGVSGTDIPSGRTIVKYRIGMSGAQFTNPTVNKSFFVQINTSESAIVNIPYSPTDQTTNGPWLGTVNGAAPTEANLISAGISYGIHTAEVQGALHEIWIEALYNDLPTAPTITSPFSGTINTDIPLLFCSFSPQASGARVKAIWDIDTDPGFASPNHILFTEPDGLLRISGAPSFGSLMPDTDKLHPATWYIRAHGIDEFGLEGTDYSSTGSFVVTHPSSALQITPNNSSTPWNLGNVQFTWQFSDPSATDPNTGAVLDVQTAYQIQIYANGNATLVVDTGKLFSATSTHQVTLPSMYNNVPLTWRIQVWDEGDQTAGYSTFQPFQTNAVGGVSITSITTNSPNPLVEWSFTGVGDSVQTKFRVSFQTTPLGSDNYNSGLITSADEFFQVPVSFLHSGDVVTAFLEVTDSAGFVADATYNYTADFSLPSSQDFEVDSSLYDTEDFGYVKITWTNAGQDENWYSYQVWRSLDGGSTHEVIFSDSTSSATVDYEFDDYLAPANSSVTYSVVQTTLPVGGIPGAEIPGIPTWKVVITVDNNYWIIDTTFFATHYIQLRNVTADTFTDEIETQILQVIGRGQKTDIGTDWGINGTLTVQVFGTALNSAHVIKNSILAVAKAAGAVYLRTPFSDLFLVNFGNVQFDRVAGVGINEYFEATIPYNEVT